MRRAFTLVELIVSIAIIAVLIALLIPAVGKVREAGANTQCRNNLHNLGVACHAFHDVYRIYPRNTVRPRGTTPIDGEPPGNVNAWKSGSFESWLRELTPFLEQKDARAQDPLLMVGCPADPRGFNYVVPGYGFTWYVGTYSNPSYVNDGIILDDSNLQQPMTLNSHGVLDGLSNTLLMAERPPPADGQWGWWDSPCCIQDTISPVRGSATISPLYNSSVFGNCAQPQTYQLGNVLDNCYFNALWSNHPQGGFFCMGDGSVRVIGYAAGNAPAAPSTVLEALATRAGSEVLTLD